MSVALTHVFGLGALVIVGRGLPGLVIQGVRRGAALVRKPSAPIVEAPPSNLLLEQNP